MDSALRTWKVSLDGQRILNKKFKSVLIKALIIRWTNITVRINCYNKT